MKRAWMSCLVLAVTGIGVVSSRADTHYVAQGGQTPSGNYTNWASAVSNIQDAITVSSDGDEVVVSNGVYETGGTFVSMTNRVYINKAITVRSANNDPTNTVIKGAKDNGGNGPAAVRPVYMTAGSLIGFMVTNGATASNSSTFSQSANYVGGGVYCSSTTPIISNCVIIANQSQCNAGGVYQGTLNNCRIVGNSTVGWDGQGGGGAYAGILYNCTIMSNSVDLVAGHYGGGVQNATVSNCTIVGNQAGDGGGTAGGTLYNCLIAGNHASRSAGGTMIGVLYNCTIAGNWAGGGTFDPGGVGRGNGSLILVNCIIYNNSCAAGNFPNWFTGNGETNIYFTNSCITPAPAGGFGNTSADPQFRSNGSGYGTNLVFGDYHLGSLSPCINTGTNRDWMTVDLDGGARIKENIVDMGAYEGGIAETHYVAQGGQTPSPNYISWATAASNIQDAINAAVAGDQVVVSNGLYDTGGTLAAGCTVTNRVYINKALTIRSANNDPANTIIKGAKDNGTNGPAAVRPVYMTAGSLIGFTLTNGATASGIVEDASHWGGGLYCSSIASVISNCVIAGNQSGHVGGGSYQGTLINCRIVGNSTVGSDGKGGGGTRDSNLLNCLVMSNSTAFAGGYYGGGVQNGIISNCTIIGNRAGDGGGTSGGTVYNSLIAGNYASRSCGGTVCGNLYNCTIVGNWANDSWSGTAGGVGQANGSLALINCIVYYNNSFPGNYPDWYYPNADRVYITNTCITGVTLTNGNITAGPKFVSNGSGYGTNLVFGNYHLGGNSPCVNAGTNQISWMTVDLDGLPRIRYGTADMGAYEFLHVGTVVAVR